MAYSTLLRDVLTQLRSALLVCGFIALGVLLPRSSLRVALGESWLRSAGVLLTAGLGALAVSLTSYLGDVDKRFDAIDARIDAAQKQNKKRFDALDTAISELKTLVTSTRAR